MNSLAFLMFSNFYNNKYKEYFNYTLKYKIIIRRKDKYFTIQEFLKYSLSLLIHIILMFNI